MAVPEHQLLIFLDEANGKPVYLSDLANKISAHLFENKGELLAKYVDLEEFVSESIDYMSSFQLVDRTDISGLPAAKITALGSLMAVGIKKQDSKK